MGRSLKLTEQERIYIARRAAGEYAIIPAVRRIVNEHRKNRDLDDQVFLEFASLTLQKSYKWEDYERLAKRVLAIIPHPNGKQVYHTDAAPPQPAGKKRRTVTCGICSGKGHNARSCPAKPDAPTMTSDDGIERLTPGYDPNPPETP